MALFPCAVQSICSRAVLTGTWLHSHLGEITHPPSLRTWCGSGSFFNWLNIFLNFVLWYSRLTMLWEFQLKFRFLMSFCRKNTLRDKVIDKKWVYLESGTSTDRVWAISGDSSSISFFVRYLFTSFARFSIGSILLWLIF